MWPDWALLKGFGVNFPHKSGPNYWGHFGLIWKNVIIWEITAFATFGTTFGKIGLLFHSIIWSHCLARFGHLMLSNRFLCRSSRTRPPISASPLNWPRRRPWRWPEVVRHRAPDSGSGRFWSGNVFTPLTAQPLRPSTPSRVSRSDPATIAVYGFSDRCNHAPSYRCFLAKIWRYAVFKHFDWLQILSIQSRLGKKLAQHKMYARNT